LCRFVWQITRIFPCRRMIWHLSQRFLTEADTFISSFSLAVRA
jgi:hypothetical protein